MRKIPKGEKGGFWDLNQTKMSKDKLILIHYIRLGGIPLSQQTI